MMLFFIDHWKDDMRLKSIEKDPVYLLQNYAKKSFHKTWLILII